MLYIKFIIEKARPKYGLIHFELETPELIERYKRQQSYEAIKDFIEKDCLLAPLSKLKAILDLINSPDK